MTLADLPIDEPHTIHRVGGSGSFRRRLLEMGLVPGTRVMRTGAAPLGDPMSFRVRGAVVTLRRADARDIEVES